MDNTAQESSTPEPMVAVRVLVTPTVIGELRCAAGAELRLPKSEAETLAGLTPPLVEIIGI